MTVYGDTSRISVDHVGGGIAAVDIDVDQKVVIFARGDPSTGSASVESPTQVTGPGQLSDTFGADTEIIEYFRQAAANGVGYDMIWGVMPTTTSVTAESVASGSGTLANNPIIEDTSEISVQNTTAGSSETPVFGYASPPATGNLASDEVAIDPFTGEVEAGDSDDYEIDYKYLEWQNAFDSAVSIIEEQELGQWVVGSEAGSVVSDAASTIEPLRTNQWKMVRVAGVAQPNKTSTDGDAIFNVSGYSDAIDDDSTFLAAPTREEDSKITLVGALGGVMAANSIDDPIIGDVLQGVGRLEETLNVPDQETLEDSQLIPVSNLGAPAIEGNLSTSTASDWVRSFFARRLSDRLILAARAVAKNARGRVNNERTGDLVEQQLADEIVELVADGVLEPNTEAETKWFVTAEEDPNDARELDVSFGFTPEGVVDTVEVDSTINY